MKTTRPTESLTSTTIDPLHIIEAACGHQTKVLRFFHPFSNLDVPCHSCWQTSRELKEAAEQERIRLRDKENELRRSKDSTESSKYPTAAGRDQVEEDASSF